MVFHVTRADIADLALKLVKQIHRVLAEDIDQHIQSAPMRHTNADFLGAITTNSLNSLSHHGNQAFAALEAKSLGARVL